MRAGGMRAGWWWAMAATLALASPAPPDIGSALAQRLAQRLLNKFDQTKELIVSGLILPKSLLNSGTAIAKELLKNQDIGGYPILKEPTPSPTFLVVGEGDQNETRREDPYQDISARAKGAAAPSGVAAGAAGAVGTRAALLKAFAVPDALRAAKFGSNFVPGDNVFLLGAVKIVLGI